MTTQDTLTRFFNNVLDDDSDCLIERGKVYIWASLDFGSIVIHAANGYELINEFDQWAGIPVEDLNRGHIRMMHAVAKLSATTYVHEFLTLEHLTYFEWLQAHAVDLIDELIYMVTEYDPDSGVSLWDEADSMGELIAAEVVAAHNRLVADSKAGLL